MVRTLCLLLALGYLSTGAAAQSAADPMELCYQEPDGAPRLACFNHEMQRRHAAGAPAVAVTSPNTVAVAKARAADTVGFQGADLRKKLKAEGVEPEPEKPIVAAVVRLLPQAAGRYAFELDNGQTWAQADDMANLNVRPHDTVTIKAGMLGSFYMTTSRSQRIRVHRSR
ncbi:MAG: hypothetical protein WDM77_14000 [Steroidobacteraceae bacterium]